MVELTIFFVVTLSCLLGIIYTLHNPIKEEGEIESNHLEIKMRLKIKESFDDL